MNAATRGRVVAAHGRHYVVQTEAFGRLLCFTRGRKTDCACGDEVDVERASSDQGLITALRPRRNLLLRSNAFRAKRLAANLDRVVVVVATAPPFSEELLGRILVAAESVEVPALIVLNKVDLTDRLADARALLSLYAALGYTVHEASVKRAPDAALADLGPAVARGTTLLAGQSGMGKSSLLNLLVPDAQAATREISEALQTGKHTTTDARLYVLPDRGVAEAGDARDGCIVDTPGFQEFGLSHLTPGQVERAFPELRPFLGRCRFANCTHLHEPGCAVLAATDAGQVARRRYDLFAKLTRESSGFRDR